MALRWPALLVALAACELDWTPVVEGTCECEVTLSGGSTSGTDQVLVSVCATAAALELEAEDECAAGFAPTPALCVCTCGVSGPCFDTGAP